LRRKGVIFDNCYCAAPLAAPPHQLRHLHLFSEHNHRTTAPPTADVTNLVTALKSPAIAGMFGKNHLFTYHA
jgi:hypothetical protein